MAKNQSSNAHSKIMATSTNTVRPPAAPPASLPKNRKRIILLIALVVLGITAAAAAYYYLDSKGKATPAVTAPAYPIFVALEPFTVNLQPNGRSRFLHVGLTLKVADIKSQSQVMQYLPEVRSRILTALSNRESESLLTPQSKVLLAGEIMTALNQPFAPNLPPQKIASVMFTAFMLQ